MSINIRRLDAKGDTIVEVLIAVAIASIVLVSAFVVVRHTLANTQQAQEHVEAINYVQGQVEQLKSLASQTGNSVFAQTSPFCIVAGAIDTNLSHCTVGPSGRYQLTITPPAAGSNTFNFTSTWSGPTGLQEKVSINYVLYK